MTYIIYLKPYHNHQNSVNFRVILHKMRDGKHKISIILHKYFISIDFMFIINKKFRKFPHEKYDCTCDWCNVGIYVYQLF